MKLSRRLKVNFVIYNEPAKKSVCFSRQRPTCLVSFIKWPFRSPMRVRTQQRIKITPSDVCHWNHRDNLVRKETGLSPPARDCVSQLLWKSFKRHGINDATCRIADFTILSILFAKQEIRNCERSRRNFWKTSRRSWPTPTELLAINTKLHSKRNSPRHSCLQFLSVYHLRLQSMIADICVSV